jgi:hypothetical protein
MRADISRSTFRQDNHYSAVVQQQGRVILDAEANEQAAIQTQALRTFITDLVGPHAGPQVAENSGAFGITLVLGKDGKPANLSIRASGRYYVDGIAVEASRPQPLEAATSTDAGGEAPSRRVYLGDRNSSARTSSGRSC